MLDLDGTLYEWHSSVYRYMVMYGEYKGSYTDFWTDEYKKKNGDWWAYITGIDTLYSDSWPTKDCIDFLDSIKNRFEIFYVTGRPPSVEVTTAQYLKRFDFPYRDNLIFNPDKANISRLIQASYAIDDLPPAVEELFRVTNIIMRARPWNKELWNTYPTVHSLMDSLQYLKD